jgi:glycosyltransferase involved in cell wall biosynthesis
MIKFDIVIATYNSGKTLERCLQSVRDICGHASPNVIIIDGKSTDDTLAIVECFRDIVNVVVSEPDSGVYEAWNKGIGHCKHSLVIFLGSDDYLCGHEFLNYLDFAASHDDVDFISCRVRLVDPGGRDIRKVGQPWTWRAFRRYMCTAHPGSFTSIDYIRRVGGFNESLRICGDYELLMRAGPDLRTAYWPKSPVCMQTGGMSDGLRVLKETLQVKLDAGYRGRYLSLYDYAVSVAKYMVRSHLLGSR